MTMAGFSGNHDVSSRGWGCDGVSDLGYDGASGSGCCGIKCFMVPALS